MTLGLSRAVFRPDDIQEVKGLGVTVEFTGVVVAPPEFARPFRQKVPAGHVVLQVGPTQPEVLYVYATGELVALMSRLKIGDVVTGRGRLRTLEWQTNNKPRNEKRLVVHAEKLESNQRVNSLPHWLRK